MNNIPIEIVYHKIIPFNSSTEDLLNLKLVSKLFANYIKVHPLINNRKCNNCKNNRFRVAGKKKCIIKGCMSNDLFHPYDNIQNEKGLSFCSIYCCINFNYNLF